MILIVPALIAVFFFDNICGYYRFKELCAQHKELVVYQRLEPNVGWQVDTKVAAVRSTVSRYIYFMPQIQFLRYKDSIDQQLYDGKFVGSTRVIYEKFDRYTHSKLDDDMDAPENYEFLLFKIENKPTYQLEVFNEEIPNEVRMSRGGYRIRNLRTNQVVVTLEDIGYSTFDINHTLLAAPSGNICRVAPSIMSSAVNQQIFEK